MADALRFTKQEIMLVMKRGCLPQTVSALVCGDWAVHKSINQASSRWRVSYKGVAVLAGMRQRDAKAFVRAVLAEVELPELSVRDMQDVHDGVCVSNAYDSFAGAIAPVIEQFTGKSAPRVGVPQPTLSAELVPRTCWGRNVRSEVPRGVWDKLRREVYRVHDHRCAVCDNPGDRLHCHEVWAYTFDRYGDPVQRLVKLTALCARCHEVKHVGKAERVHGDLDRVIDQLMRVNGWTVDQAERHLQEAANVYLARSELDWRLDLSVLRSYGVNIDAITAAKEQ